MMINKNEVKYIQSLSDKKNRDNDGVFVAEGPKVVTELFDNGLVPQIIYTAEQNHAFDNKAFEVRQVTAPELQRLSHLNTANEVIGIFHKKVLPSLHTHQTFTLVLDGIQDPGNMGTIIRTADWFGVTQIIASPDSADCYNSKVVQSTMGSIARINVYYENLADLLSRTTVPIYGAKLNGQSIFNMEKVRAGILVIGNESKGIRPEINPFIKKTITIPKAGKAESLNAAVATGILLSYLL